MSGNLAGSHVIVHEDVKMVFDIEFPVLRHLVMDFTSTRQHIDRCL